MAVHFERKELCKSAACRYFYIGCTCVYYVRESKGVYDCTPLLLKVQHGIISKVPCRTAILSTVWGPLVTTVGSECMCVVDGALDFAKCMERGIWNIFQAIFFYLVSPPGRYGTMNSEILFCCQLKTLQMALLHAHKCVFVLFSMLDACLAMRYVALGW